MFDQNPIRPIDLHFDVEKIIKVYDDVWHLENPENHQISITSVDGKDTGSGIGNIDSLNFEESRYNVLNEVFKNTYMEYVHNTLLEKFEIVRGRFMTLIGKTCYTYHSDPTWRLHIPVVTNVGGIFVIDDKVFRLENTGQVYLVNTTIVHSAINMSMKDRLHIVYGLKTF